MVPTTYEPHHMKKLVTMLFFFLLGCPLLGAQQKPNKKIVTKKDELRLEIKSLLDSSNVHYFKGNYVKSLKFNVDILNKALELNDPKYIHQGYRFLGYDYLVLKDTALAKESFEKSKAYAKISKNDTAIAQTNMDLANLYSSIYKDWDQALYYHDQSIKLFDKVKDSTELSNAHYNTIITAMNADSISKAIFHLKACERFKKFHNKSLELGLNNYWGSVHIEQKEYKKADARLERSIAEAIAEGFPIELADAYSEYSRSLFEQERYKEAFDVRKKYEETLISNMEFQQNKESESVSAQFQVEEYKKDVEAAELTNQLQAEIVENKSKLNNILTIISVFGLLLFLWVLFAYRRRKELVQQLKDKNKEYLVAKERSEKLSKAKSNFFSTVSHELRTPLYGVIGLSSLLLEDPSLKSHEKDLKSLKFSANYLLALINDVLNISKIESYNLEDEQEVFNLHELLESIISSFEYMRLQNNNSISVDISKGIPFWLKGNPVQLSQVLMNLVGNACKFTENGSIVIEALEVNNTDTQTDITFSVKDTGIGISKEKHIAIFEEFSQVENNNYTYQGTGLGLPIVKKLLARSNSEIELKSELGKGSEFTFTLSFIPTEKEPLPKELAIMDPILLKNKKILIAEDNRINQIVTKKILENNGMTCVIATNGKEAVLEMKNQKFDLILMDLNMPIMDGFEASRQIRLSHTKIPIVALTAVEVEEVRNKIYIAGMNDIIVKPYDINKFLQTILKNILIEASKVSISTNKKVV